MMVLFFSHVCSFVYENHCFFEILESILFLDLVCSIAFPSPPRDGFDYLSHMVSVSGGIPPLQGMQVKAASSLRVLDISIPWNLAHVAD